MTMIPPHPNLGARHGPAPITTSSWVGRQVLLRRVAAADRRILAGFDQDPTRAPYVQTDGYRHWAAHRAYHPDSPDDFQLAIETRRDQVLVGSMCTSQADEPGVFSYGVGIGPMHRRHGYADDAIITLLAVMFGRRRFRKCQVGIYQENVASLALHSKLGFREEGRTSEPDSLSDGMLHLVIMGLTAEAFTTKHLPRSN
ncbi:GNAT family N-acetyltransferase [Saccharopolyspora sp. NPDC049426]|uniref:GNAT family N-acetyltransferase n=1 Tax=unclassified Saccharopolyspora TaxID=2646250 RepID=UPI003440B847